MSNAALVRFFVETSMFWIFLTCSNLVWPIFYDNLSLGSIFVVQLLVYQIFVSDMWLVIVNILKFVTAIYNLRNCFFSKKPIKSPKKSRSMTSNSKNRSVVNNTFSRFVMFSEVCGCNSPVKQSGEYNPNWSYLIVPSLKFQGYFSLTQGWGWDISEQN